MRTLFLIAFSSGLCLLLQAQSPDQLPAGADTLRRPVDKEQGFFKKDYPDPMKAGIMSLVLPGSGQIYNGRWWKVPLVYGALGGMVYAIVWNTDQYNRFQTAYQLKLDDQPHEFSGTSFDNAQALRSIRDTYDKNRQLSYVGLVFVYLLNGIEAFVDAHLQNFDISEDLSLRVRPRVGIDAFSQQPVWGIGLRIPLQAAAPPPPPVRP
mgnify:CR=1 FL=1